jgi:membrane protein YdbS with pleckstrin-like domain
MSNKNPTNLFEMGLPTLLFIVFLILKLTNNIDWSWWWVTSPLWVPIVLAIGFVALLMVIAILIIILNKGDV